MHMLDYTRLRLTNGDDFDLLGVHYFQRINPWLYGGIGAFAPMVGGNEGGFFGFAGTLHAQHRIRGNGFGSAGWVTDHTDTGPGRILDPRVALEYQWDHGLDAQLSAGYLAAPFGTARNWTFGLGLNDHLTHGTRDLGATGEAEDDTLRRIRLNVFKRRTSDINCRGSVSNKLSPIAVQADYALNENWYAADQLAVAANRFRGYAGFAEALVGLGCQRNLVRSGRLQD